jgi:ankyrin repeat protein
MQIIEMLIDAQANVSAKDENLQTPLHCAARNGRVEAVRRLMDVVYEQAIKASENANKKVNENRWRSRDMRKRRRNADMYRATDDDSDEDDYNLEELSSFWHGQR